MVNVSTDLHQAIEDAAAVNFDSDPHPLSPLGAHHDEFNSPRSHASGSSDQAFSDQGVIDSPIASSASASLFSEDGFSDTCHPDADSGPAHCDHGGSERPIGDHISEHRDAADSDDDLMLGAGVPAPPYPIDHECNYGCSDSELNTDSDDEDRPHARGPRQGSGAWLHAQRLEPLATGHMRSVLQAAYTQVEFKKHGASNVVLEKILHHQRDLLKEFVGDHKIDQVRMPRSMHMVKHVLGTEDATKYEFGWCEKCALRFAADPDFPKKSRDELLGETCPQCGCAKYQVCCPSQLHRVSTSYALLFIRLRRLAAAHVQPNPLLWYHIAAESSRTCVRRMWPGDTHATGLRCRAIARGQSRVRSGCLWDYGEVQAQGLGLYDGVCDSLVP